MINSIKANKFQHEILDIPYSMSQINEEDHRYYLENNSENDIKYPSITTVLSAFDKKDYSNIPKQYVERAAARGTYMHDFCENYILNDLELPIKKSANLDIADAYNTGIDLFYQLKPFLDKTVKKVYMSESQLKSDVYRIAGTVDLFALMQGKNVVLDYKSSGRRKELKDINGYFAQGSFYSQAIEETFNMKVNGVMILISTESEGVQSFYLDRDKGEHLKYEKYLKEARKNFYKIRGF